MTQDKKNSKALKVLIVAGGTGGHIFPAIVFGRRLVKNGSEVAWLCGSRKLEKEIYSSSDIKPFIVPMSGSPLGTRSVFKALERTADIFRAFRKTSEYIASFRPDVIFMFGGYVSFVPLLISLSKKIPAVLHEQNAVAGRVTRLAGRLGAVIITGWPQCRGIDNFIPVGIPVRTPIQIERKSALETLGLELQESSKIIGVAGGSLGSGPLSSILIRAAQLRPELDFVFLSSKEKKDDGNMHFIKSQWDMNPFYSICDVLVCRAGGSTLAEALKWRIPTVTVPWPGAADNHQEENARQFVSLAGPSKAAAFSESGSPEELLSILYSYL